MNVLRKSPAAVSLIVINLVVFAFSFLQVNSFDEPGWSFNLLSLGAEFNPFTLDGQWYRIVTHMFLHGNLIHLVLNMYGLYAVGTTLEGEVGTTHFLWVYSLTGVAGALVSLYWTLFAIGVGASGAIFGLFGFSLVLNIVQSRREQQSIIPIVLNFIVFLGINLYFAQAFKADTAAHLGGLACGVIIGVLYIALSESSVRRKFYFAFIPIFIAVYFALPRYQVTYYHFFQSILAAEDSGRAVYDHPGSDEYYLSSFKRNTVLWDSTLQLLDNHSYLPAELMADTFKLRRYIKLRHAELNFRITMIERESYIYMDSLEVVQDSMKHFNRIDYPLIMTMRDKAEPPPANDTTVQYQQVKVLYNEDWEEISEPPFSYYRIGTRDSLGRWQGQLIDYYANGQPQMKGRYKNDERDGIFIYYSDHKTYSSAGRFRNDLAIGKWEFYHPNGKLHREEFYKDRYFMKNLWDSAGNQLVRDGNGQVIERYANGVIAEAGEYIDGYKEGYWYGRHENGEMYYEENFYHGRLTKGRSRTLSGETFVYDDSSFDPIPVGGHQKLRNYLNSAAQKSTVPKRGVVRLSFRVTEKGKLTDFKTIRSVSMETDEVAKQLLRDGPAWTPAKLHGHQNTDGFGFVEVDFR